MNPVTSSIPARHRASSPVAEGIAALDADPCSAIWQRLARAIPCDAMLLAERGDDGRLQLLSTDSAGAFAATLARWRDHPQLAEIAWSLRLAETPVQAQLHQCRIMRVPSGTLTPPGGGAVLAFALAWDERVWLVLMMRGAGHGFMAADCAQAAAMLPALAPRLVQKCELLRVQSMMRRVLAEDRRLYCLTDRERQVCLAIVTGHSTETIALKFGISPNSVLTYRKRLYQKLHISSQSELLFVMLRGITPAFLDAGAKPALPDSAHGLRYEADAQ